MTFSLTKSKRKAQPNDPFKCKGCGHSLDVHVKNGKCRVTSVLTGEHCSCGKFTRVVSGS